MIIWDETNEIQKR